MKSFIQILILAFIIISILLSLPYILKEREFEIYNNEQLQNSAISKGLKAIPKSYEELLKIVDKKDNPISQEKIALGKELFFDTSLSLDNNISCASCHMISKNKDEKKIILNALTSTKKPNNIENANNCVICHLGDESGTDRLSAS